MANNITTRDASGNTVNAASDEVVINGVTVQVQRVNQGPSTATVTQVASSATNVTLQASNTARKNLTIYNDSTSILYVKFGTTASTTSYTVQIGAQGYYEIPQPVYTGRVDGIWASANGNAYITETS